MDMCLYWDWLYETASVPTRCNMSKTSIRRPITTRRSTKSWHNRQQFCHGWAHLWGRYKVNLHDKLFVLLYHSHTYMHDASHPCILELTAKHWVINDHDEWSKRQCVIIAIDSVRMPGATLWPLYTRDERECLFQSNSLPFPMVHSHSHSHSQV